MALGACLVVSFGMLRGILPRAGESRIGCALWLPSSRVFIGQGDALARQIDFHDPHFDNLTRLDHVVRIVDETVSQRRDMNQAVLMHADVDERAEGGDVGHHAF